MKLFKGLLQNTKNKKTKQKKNNNWQAPLECGTCSNILRAAVSPIHN